VTKIINDIFSCIAPRVCGKKKLSQAYVLSIAIMSAKIHET
jgi:hypothetical protein